MFLSKFLISVKENKLLLKQKKKKRLYYKCHKLDINNILMPNHLWLMKAHKYNILELMINQYKLTHIKIYIIIKILQKNS